MEIKGVVHVHSTYSYDGKETLRSLKEFLRIQGISFCCLTEHTDQMTVEQSWRFVQECKALSDSTFMFIPGYEVPYKKAHMLLVGTEVFLGQYADEPLLQTWASKSALTVLAHPVRNRFVVDPVMEEAIDGIEIWNQQYEGKHMPRFRSLGLLQRLQESNQALFATGGLDFHRKEHFGAPVYTIDVDVLTREAILSALKNGAYSFGNSRVLVNSFGIWKGNESLLHKFISVCSIMIINAGKGVNKLLALFGLRLPSSLKRLIRSRV